MGEAELRQLLDQGSRLESEHRWGDALTYYENALREFPQQHDLQTRLTKARVHYDLGRRYQDNTFTASLREWKEPEALAVYHDVLLKIQTHYVRPADWTELVRSGLMNLQIALGQDSFRRENRLQKTDAEIDSFRTQLAQHATTLKIASLQHAREVAAHYAHQAEQHLGLRPQATILEFTCGAISTLDPYSCFLSSGQLEDVYSQIEGNFVGLGVELKGRDQTLEIVDVISGSPAELGGLRRGDRIVQIDSVATRDVSSDSAADLLRGPEGSYVLLRVLDPQGNVRNLRLQRRRVEVPSVDGITILDRQSGIGYLRLTSFQKTTTADIDRALQQLNAAGMKWLIMDLRGNPGGLLSSSVEVADRFLATGTIVSTRGRNLQEDVDYEAHEPGTWRVPLIVLIDGETASASEIFAGAIRDQHRGAVIGQRSYGKGSVQGIFALENAKVGVRLTTAKFYSPSGQAISNRGVSPDVVVHLAKKPVADTETADSAASTESSHDAVLDAALEYARVRLSSR